MRWVLRCLAVLSLSGSLSSWAQDGPNFPEGWTLHVSGMQIEDVSCGSERIAIRSRDGTVQLFDGEEFETLPPVVPSTGRNRSGYGNFIAVGKDGTVVMDANGFLKRWNGKYWDTTKMSDWAGSILDLEFLDSGQLVALGSGRIGLLEDDTLTSYAGATWLDMGALGGGSIVDLWSVGYGEWIFHHTVEGWNRIQAPAQGFLVGVYDCGEDCLWVWDGQGEARLGGSHRQIWQRKEGAWIDRSASFDVYSPTISGDGERPWIFSSQGVYRFNGQTWDEVLNVEMFKEDWVHLEGGCFTESQIVVVESRGRVLIKAR